jgi:regulator of sigma E protease
MTAEKLIVFLVNLSVLVVLHEYGHFIVARLCGVRVTDFAVGFGPTLLKWTSPRSGTNYRLNLLAAGRLLSDEGRGREDQRGRAAAAIP